MEIPLSALGIAMTDLIQGGQKHTISEASPALGTHTPASNDDEDAQAQKLGMGTVADSGKGKSRIYSLSKLLVSRQNIHQRSPYLDGS